MSEALEDVHRLDPREFYEHTRSFEVWFGAVQGCLEGTYFGRAPETAEEVADPGARDRLVTVLCNYCAGETIALEGAGTLIRLAPNHPAKVFLATQTVDEGRHLEVLIHRLRELGVADAESEIERRTSPSLRAFKRRHGELMASADWEGALFAQNVILEEMEFAVFHRHGRFADARTRELLMGIVKDERRHIGFGENELGRRLRESPHRRARITEVKRDLDALVLETFAETLREIGIAPSEQPDLGRAYLAAVNRLGVGGA